MYFLVLKAVSFAPHGIFGALSAYLTQSKYTWVKILSLWIFWVILTFDFPLEATQSSYYGSHHSLISRCISSHTPVTTTFTILFDLVLYHDTSQSRCSNSTQIHIYWCHENKFNQMLLGGSGFFSPDSHLDPSLSDCFWTLSGLFMFLIGNNNLGKRRRMVIGKFGLFIGVWRPVTFPHALHTGHTAAPWTSSLVPCRWCHLFLDMLQLLSSSA